MPPPIDLDYDDFTCDVTWPGDVDLTNEPSVWLAPNMLAPGTYCSEGKLSLSGSDVSGEVTLVSRGSLSLSGSDFDLSADPDDPNGVLLFSYDDSSSALDLVGSGGSWTGIIHAPRGTAKMQGSDNLTVTGSIVSWKVQVSGSDFDMFAASQSGGVIEYIYLVE